MSKLGFKGEYRVTIRNADGSVKKEMGPFTNKITDLGLNRMFLGNWLTCIMVGTGSSEPSATQTSLDNVLSSSRKFTSVSVNERELDENPAFIKERVIARFEEDWATGNISEMGVGWYVGDWSSRDQPAPSELNFFTFSRVLPRDELGNPVTITVISTDIVDVEFILTLYVDTSIRTTYSEIAGVSRTIEYRPVYMNYRGNWRIFTRDAQLNSPGRPFQMAGYRSPARDSSLYGGFEPIDSSNIPTSTDSPSTTSTFKDTDFQEDVTHTWEYLSANTENGIGWFFFHTGNRSLASNLGYFGIACLFMFKIDPPIPKTENDNLDLTVRISVNRAGE